MDMQTEPYVGSVMDRIAPISAQIWDAKYRLKTPDGLPIDVTIEDTWRRVARALAEAEERPADWEQAFYHALADFRFLPAGRILSGAGTDRRVTLFNCFVMGDIEDDLGSIFAHLREAALTMQQGGGIGYDFSSLRPSGAPVRGVGADASGPLSFMDVWDAMCRTIMSAGARRGAMMATMRCDHPDIEAFIEAKRVPGRLRNFNLSVLVTDPFMAAVEGDTDWSLVFAGKTYRTVRARALWDRITRATYDYAEPGVIFIDRINARNNLAYCETIHSTNPCGEQPLPPYGACLLGSVNLAALVREPFSREARVDGRELAELVTVAVRMMDNTIDISGFPLEAQRREAVAKRRIGLGMTGLADALIMCGLRYGSAEAAARAGEWARQIERAAYVTSAQLAREKGAFPLFDREAYLAGETVRGLDEEVRALIAAHGIRNALLTSVAPTGTISLVADNVSSGIEPVFALAYTRKVLQPDGSRREEEVSDHAVRAFRAMFGAAAELPDYFVTVADLLAFRACAHAGRRPAARGQRHFEDRERAGDDRLRGVPGCLSRRLAQRLQGLHDLSAEQRDRVGAGGAAGGRAGAGRAAAGRADAAHREADRRHLQAALAGCRARDVCDHQRHRAGRHPTAVRGVRQFQEPGTLCLGGGADADDQRRVPARRRGGLCRRGTQAGVRSARRAVEQWPLRALAGGRDRRCDRAAHGADRVSQRAGAGGRQAGAAGAAWRRRGASRAGLPALQPARAGEGGGLPELPALRLVEMRVSAPANRLAAVAGSA